MGERWDAGDATLAAAGTWSAAGGAGEGGTALRRIGSAAAAVYSSRQGGGGNRVGARRAGRARPETRAGMGRPETCGGGGKRLQRAAKEAGRGLRGRGLRLAAHGESESF